MMMSLRRSAAPLALLSVLCTPLGCGPRVDDEEESSTQPETEGGVPSTTSGGTTSAEVTSATDEPADDSAASTGTDEPPRPTCEHELNPGVFLCDPWVQDCPEGEKCAVFSSNGASYDATHCVPLADERKGLGEVCTPEGNKTGHDDCELGAMCWRLGGGTDRHPVCVSLCGGCSDAPDCPEGDICISFSATLNLCIPECDPFAGDCPVGTVCSHVDDCTFYCAPHPEGPPSHGEPCIYNNECEAGARCVEAELFGPTCEGLRCCSRYCEPNDPSADATCDERTPGQSCVPLCIGGNVDLGVCGVQ